MNISAANIIRSELSKARPSMAASDLANRTDRITKDLVLLARAAISKCLITYSNAIDLRGHGNAQNGQWLDEVFAYAILPLGFPDLTMLVVNKSTKQPSPDAFEARRSKLSKVHVDDIQSEQMNCFWFTDYEAVLGPLLPIPAGSQLVRYLTPQPAIDREINRAVSNAANRISGIDKEKTLVGKEYLNSVTPFELKAAVKKLWEIQKGKCALTNKPFELRDDQDGGIRDDRVSIDRINNSYGYYAENIQLVTQFANRARGTLDIAEAKKRLKQYPND